MVAKLIKFNIILLFIMAILTFAFAQKISEKVRAKYKIEFNAGD